MADVRDKLAKLPAEPGVYLFRDDRGDVLYVGKAKSLRPRVRSYFQAGRGECSLTLASLPVIAERVFDRDHRPVAKEVEMQLERHQPLEAIDE